MKNVTSCIFIGCLTIVALVIFQRHSSRVSADFSALALDVADALKSEFANSDSIVFRSWNGKWGGTDEDVDVRLTSDGRCQITSYSSIKVFKSGTYSIKNQHELVLTLKNEDQSLALFLLRDGSSLLLFQASSEAKPTNCSWRIEDGNLTKGKSPSLWPFRQMVAD